jgi:deoxyribonuclease-4
MIFGAHMSTSGGVARALERGASIGCGIVQIFVKNNMQWSGRAPSAEEIAAFAAARIRGGFKTVFGHTGYLINPGGPPSANRAKSLASLVQEISFAGALGLPFLVLHPGAHLGDGEARGLERIIAGLDEVLAATKDSAVRIALENTAGQGTCLGYKIEHLAAIFDGVQAPARLGLCLDTAHFFAAGFDLRAPGGWDAAIKRVGRLIGLTQILAFHLNDSKTDLGSRVDRHEHIGRGKIGLEAFRHIVNDARFAKSPGCLETPKSEDLHEDVENLATLRSLVKGV